MAPLVSAQARRVVKTIAGTVSAVRLRSPCQSARQFCGGPRRRARCASRMALPLLLQQIETLESEAQAEGEVIREAQPFECQPQPSGVVVPPVA